MAAMRGLLQARGSGTRSSRCRAGAVRGAGRAYRRKVLPSGPVRVAVEGGPCNSAGSAGSAGAGNEKRAGFVRDARLGYRGPIEALYPHFGITAEAVAEKVEALI